MNEPDMEIAAEAVGWIRAAAKRVTGGNCTFADDDLAVLEHLASRAVSAGLTDGLHPKVAQKAARAIPAGSFTYSRYDPTKDPWNLDNIVSEYPGVKA